MTGRAANLLFGAIRYIIYAGMRMRSYPTAREKGWCHMPIGTEDRHVLFMPVTILLNMTYVTPIPM